VRSGNDSTMTEIEALRAELKELEECVNYLMGSPVSAAVQSRLTATLKALASIVRDLAKREGVDPERFQKVFSQRTDIYYQHELEQVENDSPNLAAKISAVLPSVGTDDDPMPLFPEED
jgi:hypothetical protein